MTIIKHQQHHYKQRQEEENNDRNNNSREQVIFERKIEAVTSDLTPHFKSLMYSISEQNALIICDYLIGQNKEINPSSMYRRSQIQALIYFSKYMKNVPFREIKRDDIINYLDSLRKPEVTDPLHKWIGTYNLRQVYLDSSSGYIILSCHLNIDLRQMYTKTSISFIEKRNPFTKYLIYGLKKMTLCF
jgi:hypothetical protein